MIKEKSYKKTQTANPEDNRISNECLMACLYFLCLPFTVVTTPYGSLLKVVTMPVILVLSVRMLMGKSELTLNYVHFIYAVYVLYGIFLLFVFSEDIAVTTTKDMVLGLLMFFLISLRIYNKKEAVCFSFFFVKYFVRQG